MRSPLRSLLALLVVMGGISACDSPDVAAGPSVTKTGFSPLFAKIKATDSTMAETDVVYSDTGLVMKRLAPLDSDIVASAVIGPQGGEIKIDAAGGKISFPAGALSEPTLITMRALKGWDVAYDFQPHGITFNAPVKIQQDLRVTWASKEASLLKDIRGGYYDADLDSAWTDPYKFFARVKENQLGYLDQTKNPSQVKFYVGHFSGYLVSCGRTTTFATQ